MIHGGIGREERLAGQEAFRHDPDVQVLLVTDAAGEGINLQRAHLMVNYDLPWNGWSSASGAFIGSGRRRSRLFSVSDGYRHRGERFRRGREDRVHGGVRTLPVAPRPGGYRGPDYGGPGFCRSARRLANRRSQDMVVTRIEALGFRSLRYVSQRLGPFHVLVGANASGKSAFLDDLAFLGDLQRVGVGQAIAGNAARDVALRAVDPQHLTWMRRGSTFELAVEAAVPDDPRDGLRSGPASVCRYEVAVDVSGPLRIAVETLRLKPDGGPVPEPERTEFPSPPEPPACIVTDAAKRAPNGWRRVVARGSEPERVTFRAETSARSIPLRIPTDRSALANLPADIFPAASRFRRMLVAGVQRIAPKGDAMRRPSPPGCADSYRPDARNLPHVIDAMAIETPERYRDWLSHVREALPDVENVTTIKRPEDGHRYLVVRYRNGLEAPSWLVSEGALRFLALTLLAYVTRRDGPYLVEEPENGIHPRDVETLMDSLSSIYDGQILVATHSPAVVRCVRADQLLCFARSDERGTDVVVGSAHPRLRDWPGAVDLGLLLASGVLG